MLLLYQLRSISAIRAPGFPKCPDGTFGASAGNQADRRCAAKRNKKTPSLFSRNGASMIRHTFAPPRIEGGYELCTYYFTLTLALSLQGRKNTLTLYEVAWVTRFLPKGRVPSNPWEIKEFISSGAEA